MKASGYIAGAAALLLWTHAAAASSTQAPPQRKGECHWVHGRFAVYNGSEVQRIWIVGTKRLVAIPDDYPDIPRVIQSYEKAGPFEDALFADLRICALENSKPEHMQHVRVEDIRNAKFRGKPFVRDSVH
jgi:hypothetical protein